MFKPIALAVPLAVPLAAALAVAAPAFALAATTAAPMPSPGQSAAPTQSPALPFSIAPAAPKSNDQDADQSLAARLSQSNGTIHPPPVDPGMTKVPPQTGTMPVVKPPPDVQSK